MEVSEYYLGILDNKLGVREIRRWEHIRERKYRLLRTQKLQHGGKADGK